MLNGCVNAVTSTQWLQTSTKSEKDNEYVLISSSRDQVMFVWKITLAGKKKPDKKNKDGNDDNVIDAGFNVLYDVN